MYVYQNVFSDRDSYKGKAMQTKSVVRKKSKDAVKKPNVSVDMKEERKKEMRRKKSNICCCVFTLQNKA